MPAGMAPGGRVALLYETGFFPSRPLFPHLCCLSPPGPHRGCRFHHVPPPHGSLWPYSPWAPAPGHPLRFLGTVTFSVFTNTITSWNFQFLFLLKSRKPTS